MSKRLSVNINDETANVIEELGRQYDISVTETIRRAVSVYDYFANQQKSGGELQVAHADGSVTQVVLLP